MTPEDFLLHITMIVALYFMKDMIAETIDEKLNLEFKFKPEWISYVLVVWLVIVVIIGMLIDTTTPFGQLSVSDSIEDLEPAPGKPHRFFDINFDIFKF